MAIHGDFNHAEFNSEWCCAEPSVGRTRILVAEHVKRPCSCQISIMRSSNRNGVVQSQASLPTKLGATRFREEFNQHPLIKPPKTLAGVVAQPFVVSKITTHLKHRNCKTLALPISVRSAGSSSVF